MHVAAPHHTFAMEIGAPVEVCVVSAAGFQPGGAAVIAAASALVYAVFADCAAVIAAEAAAAPLTADAIVTVTAIPKVLLNPGAASAGAAVAAVTVVVAVVVAAIPTAQDLLPMNLCRVTGRARLTRQKLRRSNLQSYSSTEHAKEKH